VRAVRSEIKYLKNVCKSGAYGDVNSYGTWLYGRRPDGKTVPVNREARADGTMEIWSETNLDGEFVRYVTEFSSDEWRSLCLSLPEEFSRKVNLILFSRPK